MYLELLGPAPQHHVGRLQVQVDDAVTVDIIQSLNHFLFNALLILTITLVISMTKLLHFSSVRLYEMDEILENRSPACKKYCKARTQHITQNIAPNVKLTPLSAATQAQINICNLNTNDQLSLTLSNSNL